MTYLFKLARRLAFARTAAVAVLIAACSQSAPRDFLGPEPGTPSASNTPVSLQIASHPGAVAHDGYLRFAAWGRNAAGDSIAVHVTWAASAGEIQPDGTFRATSPGQQTITAFATSRPSVKASTTVLVGEPGPIFTGLKILPEPVAVFGGNSVQFNATARLTVNGATTAPAVTWMTTGGTIDAQGRFVAPSAPGQYQVSATTLDGRLTATVGVTVKEEVLVQLRLNPKAAVIPGGGSQDFFVNAAWSSGATALPVLQWETEAGTIVPIAPGMGPMGSPGNGNGNAGGRLQGGTTPGTFKVIARHPHSGKSDTATVTILPTLAEFWLTPREVDLVPGAAVTFSAGGRMTDGQTVSVTPGWLATGGTITGSGVFTAGSQAGTFRVIASAGTGSLADTAIVRIAHPAATLSQVVISPRSGTQGTGAILQFGASATWSDGSTALPALVWSADAGTITADGRWTAPQVAGTVRVRVADASGTRADTAVITVQMTAPTLTSLRLAPAVAEVGDGQSVTFTPSATWSNGGTSVPSLVWSATGGAITQGGKWTAPVGHPGTYKVVARQAGGTLADTATVTVASVPQVTAITVSPSVAATAPKGTVQFAATATWSDGQPRAVSFVWQATGGTITANGLYTAGALAGQFLVVASCTGCPVADTVAVSVTEPVQEQAPVLTNLVLNPSAFTLAPGQTRALNVAASWSDGSTAVPPLSWEATGGTVSNLVYTAGPVAGSYRIIVKHQGGTLADTTAVTIGVAPLTVVSLAVTPDSVSVPSGYSVSFGVSGKTASGATVTPSVSWSATGGSITSAGVYTAGLASGSYRVIAKCVGCALADTAVVVVGTASTPPPPTGSVGDLVVFPNEEIAFIIGPQLKSGATSNPWPWFDQNATEKGLQFGSAFPANPSLESDRDNYLNRNYYDLGLALYTEYYRTGNPTLLAHARKVTDSWWLLPNADQGTNTDWDNSFSPRSSSLGSLMLRALDGRPEMWPWITGYTRYMLNIYVSRWIGQDYIQGARDGGYMLLYGAMLARVHPDPTVRAEFTTKVRAAGVNYYAANQYPDGSWRWEDSYQSEMTGKFMQPFMVGLLLEGMVAAHVVTGEPAILSAITKSVENIYTAAYRKDEAVPERPTVNWRGMWYFMYGNECNPATAPKCGTSNLEGGWDTNSIRGVRQMNPHLIHAFGYAYAKTGDTRYRSWGDEIFAATFGKGQGPLTDAYYSLADFREKEYNAAYRSSGRYLAWRLGN